MAKKKFKLNLSFVISLAAAVMALVAILLMFAPAINSGLKSVYTGAQVTFGYKTEKLGGEIFKFSFGNLVPYILSVVGIVCGLLSCKCKYANFVAAGCYLIAGILFFLVVVMCVPALGDDVKELYTLGAGAIVAGILSICSAIASGLAYFVKK